MLVRHAARVLSYRDALVILGYGESPTIVRLGRMAGVAAAAVNIASVGQLAFFELRDELVDIGNTTVRGLRERLAGVSRMTQTERIAAAHSVLVITAFYEALDALPLKLRSAELTRGEQVAIATDASALNQYDELVTALVDAKVPIPTPDVSFERVLDDLEDFYRSVIEKLLRFLAGLAAFPNALDELAPEKFDQIPHQAIAKYEASFISLAAEVPEFAFWISMTDSRVTRGAIAGLRTELSIQTDRVLTGLSGVEQLLARVSRTTIVHDYPRLLTQYYRAQLDKPLLDAGDTPEGVVLPPLREIYVNPACQVHYAAFNSLNVAEDSWWLYAGEHPDIQAFLAGHLTSPVATRAPLVVLGQPGSGKSVLTRMLAANLPAQDYLPIRVELRAVPADAPIPDQIMQAVRATIDADIDWHTLLSSAGDALPVVLLDGFDEVLQATGVNQSNYLERVREFQERQADLGRPVAVLVTSRTSVAHRARIPAGSAIVRLKPFDDVRVGRWLEIWARYNTQEMASRGRLPLTVDAALAQPELAREPLLLFILTLFDATDNVLQHEDTRLGRVELYENLLRVFARREVVRLQPQLPEDEVEKEVERELHRLSVAALAMFNRRKYSVSEDQLNHDLKTLLPNDSLFERTVRGDLNRPLTPAQLVLGRFFFVHKSEAVRDTGPQELVYEFLHATFGDFLVARLTVRAVLDVARIHGYQSGTVNPAPPDLGFLYVAISHNLLCERAPLMEFCAGMFERLPASERRACRAALIENLKSCFTGRLSTYATIYSAIRYAPVIRLALVSANLVLLAVHADGSPLDVRSFAADAVFTPQAPQDIRQCWEVFVGTWSSIRSLSPAMVPWIRARYSLPYKEPEGESADHAAWTGQVDLLLTAEDGSPVSYWQSHPTPARSNSRYVRSDADLSIFEDFEVPCGSGSGLFLREIALFGTDDDVDVIAPYLRYDIPGHRLESFGVLGSVNRLLLELLLEPAPGLRRAEKYEFVLRHGQPAEQLAALRLLASDITGFDDEQAKSLLSVPQTVSAASAAGHAVDAALTYLRHRAGGLDTEHIEDSSVWTWLKAARDTNPQVAALLESRGIA